MKKLFALGRQLFSFCTNTCLFCEYGQRTSLRTRFQMNDLSLLATLHSNYRCLRESIVHPNLLE